MKFYGIDLHTDSFTCCITCFDEKSQMITRSKTHKLYNESFDKFKNTLTNNDYIVIEAGINSFWFYDQVKKLVKECYILNANKFRQNTNKTDKIDAHSLSTKLAYFIITGKKDEKTLPVVYVPDPQIRALRGLFTSYRLLRKMNAQCKNRIHSILKQNGIVIKKSDVFTVSFKADLEKLELDEIWKMQIISLYKQQEHTENEIERIKQMIINTGIKLFPKEIELLISITGFSIFTAVAVMSDVVDINRFSSVRRFCAYLRTAPKIKESNKTRKIGNVNKEARTLTCSILTQSVYHFYKAGEHFTEFYERLNKKNKAGVYRMAIIRKMLVCVYYMLKRGKKFRWVMDDLNKRKVREYNQYLKNIDCIYTDKKIA